MKPELNALATTLQGGEPLCASELHLALEDCRLRVRSNSAELLAALRGYFSHVVAAPARPDIDTIAIERAAPEPGVEFIDWQREPGKTGRKDSYADIPGGRLIRKVRTGMVFLQSAGPRIAAGPCRQYDNQLINFINSQYMTWLQHRGWLICHAAGLVYRGRCLGIAGFSGGGKSTLMLQLLDQKDVAYLTNDRLFIHAGDGAPLARGIPKLPRVNPGTIVHNPRLQPLIPAAQREHLLGLRSGELWKLEQKYDVDIARLYGPGRIVSEAPLGGFLILNWRRDSNAATAITPVDLATRPDLLAAVMKSPGPFYQHPDGTFQQDIAAFDHQAWLDVLQGVAVHEVTGRTDFNALAGRSLEDLLA